MPGYEGMQQSFAAKLKALVDASGGRLHITSGYRSPERQAQLFAAAVKKYGSEQAARKYVAPPGKSNHNHGLAADLGGDLKWAHANAARFGLTFPMSWEAWHIEELGARANQRQGHTTMPGSDVSTDAGSPEAMNDLLGKPKSWGTIEGQLANLMAAISTPTERVF